ncbi:unnamed protein product [Rangifer tarandus platyrhynchus]|uniref:Uncharacterized protein n=1 Tax=Rangifer tarandus platyrhynchus TaxID=3082113 RepID=A0ABN8XZY8_RANTA|nr:unnamed protein product [Rangifer tarandus platyrhynchus]
MLQSLVRGGPTCCGAAACHNYWCPHTRACARNNEESRAHPERRPCLLPQRRPASSSGGPAQPRVVIKNEDVQRHDSTRHTQGTRS